MKNFTFNNHFRFGWGTGTYNFSDNATLPYWVKFGKISRLPFSFRDECITAVKLIAASAEKPICVCYSGGIDSEVILTSMIDAGIECKALIMNLKYNGIPQMNRHDTAHAFEFVKKHNIEYITFEFDVNEYIKTHLLNDVKLYQTSNIAILIHADIVRRFSTKYLCILGGGDINMMRSRLHIVPPIEGMFITEHATSVSPIHAAVINNENVVNRFFMYTPELMMSWLINEDIKNFVKNERSLQGITSYNIKPLIFHKLWPELEPRPKYTGYEYIDILHKHEWGELDTELVPIVKAAKNMPIQDSSINIQYNDLIERLTPNENITSIR